MGGAPRDEADDTDDDGDGNGWLPSPVSKALKLLALALVVNFLVLPQLAGARRALEVVGGVQVGWLVVGVLLQVGAYLAHAQLTRSLLPEEARPGLGMMTRIELASRAVSHVIPGGTAAGAALNFRLLQRWGVRGADAGFAAAMQGIGSAMVLHAIVWVALVTSIPLRGFHAFYGIAAIAGIGLLSGVALGAFLLTRAEERTTDLAVRAAGHVPLLDPDGVGEVLARLAERLRQLLGDPPLLRRAAGWAAIHWLCDAASLWVFLAAFGHVVGVDALIVAFGIANMLATIPISPRGLGVVEAALITVLTAFGLPRAEAIIGVVSYRVVNFWLPIPAGAAAYLSVEVALSGERRPRRERLGELAQGAVEHAQSREAWARGRGLRTRRAEPD